MIDTLQQRAARFLRWLHNDQAGYIEIVAGVVLDPERPDKIILLMPTRDHPDVLNTREWFYLDPERPDLYAAAGAYADQLAGLYGNVYTSIRMYRSKKRAEENVKPGRVIFIDDAPAAPTIPYSTSIRTSEHSRHAYYKCAQDVTKDDARRAAAALGGDPSGVDLTQLVRFPGTSNTKNGGCWSVEPEATTGPIYNVADLRSVWPAVASRLGTVGVAWGDAYKPAEWENLPDGGALWHSAYIAAAAGQRRPDLEKLLRGERVTLIKKDDTRDDSDSAQIAALAYNLLSADVCKPQARAIADYLYTHLRPGKTREHYRAHFDAELERYTPKHYRPKEIHYLGPANRAAPQALPPAEHKPEPKSRARKDRPQQVAGAAGYLAWLRTQTDAQSGSVMLSQSQCAARLGCCVRTIKRYERALGTQIERRVFAQRQAGCLFILSPDVVPTSPADVVIADTQIAQQSAENAQPATIQVEHTAPLVPGVWIHRPELAAWTKEAFDAYPGRASFRKVQKHVDMLADGRRVNSVTLKRLYDEERTRRAYARQDAKEAEKARAMRWSSLQKKSQDIGSQAAAMRRSGDKRAPVWERRAGIYAAEESRRIESGEAPTRLLRGRGVDADEQLILAEIDEQRRQPPTRQQGTRGGVCSPQTTPIAAAQQARP